MTWSHWEDIEVIVGGVKRPIQGTPAVVSWAKGLLHLFIRGRVPDGNFYHGTYDASAPRPAWAWETVPARQPTTPLNSIAAAAWGKDRIDLFAAGADKRVYHAAWNGPFKWDQAWSGVLAGATDFTPAAASWKNSRFDIFVHTSDHHMSNLFWEGNWATSWQNVGGQRKTLNSAPAAAASGSNRIDCFALETVDRKHLIHTMFDGMSHDWSTPGGPVDETFQIAGDPAASSSPQGDGRVDVFARSSANRLIHREFLKDKWTNKWEDLGNPGSSRDIIGDPAATSWWEGGWKRFDCFALGANHTVKHTWWV